MNELQLEAKTIARNIFYEARALESDDPLGDCALAHLRAIEFQIASIKIIRSKAKKEENKMDKTQHAVELVKLDLPSDYPLFSSKWVERIGGVEIATAHFKDIVDRYFHEEYFNPSITEELAHKG